MITHNSPVNFLESTREKRILGREQRIKALTNYPASRQQEKACDNGLSLLFDRPEQKETSLQISLPRCLDKVQGTTSSKWNCRLCQLCFLNSTQRRFVSFLWQQRLAERKSSNGLPIPESDTLQDSVDLLQKYTTSVRETEISTTPLKPWQLERRVNRLLRPYARLSISPILPEKEFEGAHKVSSTPLLLSGLPILKRGVKRIFGKMLNLSLRTSFFKRFYEKFSRKERKGK